MQRERAAAACAPLHTFSTVFTLHDKPHSLRSARQYAQEICRVCPRCEFRALPQDAAASCAEPAADAQPHAQARAPMRSAGLVGKGIGLGA